MKYFIAFFRFWYDFIVGDCWQIAVGVVIVLGGGAWLSHARAIPAEMIAPVVGIGVVLIVVISLLTTAKVKK
jgi:hypothetical protein